MEVVDPGHMYKINRLDTTRDEDTFDLLVYVKRKGENYPGNQSAYAGTTMQEVLRTLIDRIQYVDRQIPHHSNKVTLTHFRAAMYGLELRAAERHGRLEEFTRCVNQSCIETYPVCSKCNHIMCHGSCH